MHDSRVNILTTLGPSAIGAAAFPAALPSADSPASWQARPGWPRNRTRSAIIAAFPESTNSSLIDFEPVAYAKIPRDAYDYTAQGVDGEFTLRRNREAFDWVGIIPRAMVDVSTVKTDTEVLGTKLQFPIIVAPSAAQGQLHPQGESRSIKAQRPRAQLRWSSATTRAFLWTRSRRLPGRYPLVPTVSAPANRRQPRTHRDGAKRRR